MVEEKISKDVDFGYQNVIFSLGLFLPSKSTSSENVPTHLFIIFFIFQMTLMMTMMGKCFLKNIHKYLLINSNNHLFTYSLADSEDYDDDGDGIPDTEDEV